MFLSFDFVCSIWTLSKHCWQKFAITVLSEFKHCILVSCSISCWVMAFTPWVLTFVTYFSSVLCSVFVLGISNVWESCFSEGIPFLKSQSVMLKKHFLRVNAPPVHSSIAWYFVKSVAMVLTSSSVSDIWLNHRVVSSTDVSASLFVLLVRSGDCHSIPLAHDFMARRMHELSRSQTMGAAALPWPILCIFWSLVDK